MFCLFVQVSRFKVAAVPEDQGKDPPPCPPATPSRKLPAETSQTSATTTDGSPTFTPQQTLQKSTSGTPKENEDHSLEALKVKLENVMPKVGPTEQLVPQSDTVHSDSSAGGGGTAQKGNVTEGYNSGDDQKKEDG